MIAKNGLDLGQETTEELEALLKDELYMDIDSEFAVEIMDEIDSRQ
jgi:cell division GTPase FtsZ